MKSDLHIHTCLSPCADKDMTPNNIVNMAKLNGLEVIGITDHNSALNCRAVYECGRKVGLKVIPGIEVTTAEEVHLLCYFDSCDQAEAFGDILYTLLPKIMNKVEIFGEQLVLDQDDCLVGRVEYLLTNAIALSIDEIIEMANARQVIPAHVDRQSYSIISNLGSVPKEYGFKKLEISSSISFQEFMQRYPQYSDYQLIQSSDAHYLHQIFDFE